MLRAKDHHRRTGLLHLDLFRRTAMSNGQASKMCNELMKCGLFNDPFDYYGHIGSGNGDRLHRFAGERCGGGLGMKR